MTKPVPAVQKYMTTCPHSLGADQTLAQASERMAELGVRHLPILERGRLVGVLSERDVQRVQTFRDVDPRVERVSDAMSADPYTVSPEAPLDSVAAEMAEKRYGSAVVVQNGKVVGLFTTTDAMRALAELLRERLAH